MSRFLKVYEPIEEGVFSDIINKISNIFKTIWSTIRNIINKIFSTIAKYINKLINVFKKFIKSKNNHSNSDISSRSIKITDKFKKDVEDKNITHIRDELTTIAHSDRTLSNGEFDAYLDYAKKANINGLFDPFDGEKFKPKEEWDKNYWSYMVASLMDNFCNERVKHLKDIGRYVYGKTTTEAANSHDSNNLCIPFHKIYGILIENENGINAISNLTIKFHTSKSLYLKKIETNNDVLDMFNGGKNGDIDNSGNIKYISSSDILKKVYNSSNGSDEYGLQPASDIARTLDATQLVKLDNKFKIKHTVLKTRVESVLTVVNDESGSLNDFISKTLVLNHNIKDSTEYKTNFNYNMNIVKSMAKAIMEELNALMTMFDNTVKAVMQEYINWIKAI